MHPFRVYISNYISIPEEDWQEIISCLTRKQYKSNTLILEEGKVCKKLYFLETGFLRYFTNQDGNDITKYFTEAPYCFTSQRSFTNNTPAEDSIEVLEDAIIWEMPQSDAFNLLRLPSWSEFVRKLIQEVQFYTEQILTAIQNKTAEERYVQMIEENNIILQKTPLKHIASYLGIAPQSLSRIRKKYQAQTRNLT
ncbi:MAG: Crp/Fnr family transcriptional regulator [Thermonemataceae bacterium]